MNMPINAREPRATTDQKALEMNLNPLIYGAIAEIGAGQEVARNFFHVGGASGTIAKATSAYDMSFSDAIYGPDDSGRYVTRNRVIRMLDREYRLVLERVADARPKESQYFAFANTVAAKRYGVESEDHGWLGINFQHQPGADPSRVVIHLGLFDPTNQAQQEALGIFGVNLIDSAFRYHDDVDQLLDSLTENLTWGRVEVDYLELDGPAFTDVDRKAAGLRLVTASLGPLVVFAPDGSQVLPADTMYKKVPLILRGSFRPFTHVHANMASQGIADMATELDIVPGDIAFFCEMNVARFLYENEDDVSDLRARVEMINELGYHAMVTSHLRFFRLAEYFQRRSLRRIGFALSIADLDTIADDSYYEGLDGGILQAIARLFASDSKLLAYPNLRADGKIRTVENMQHPENFTHLFKHLVVNRRIVGMQPQTETLVPFEPEALRQQILEGDDRWRTAVPASVQNRIKELRI